MANFPRGIIPKPPPPPGKNPMAEYNTIWQTFPLYGKSPPTQIPYVILGQHVRFLLGGGGGEKSHRWELLPYGILSGGGGGGSYVTPDSHYSANMMYPQQKNPVHTIIINHISLEICLHVSLPINLHITSACK